MVSNALAGKGGGGGKREWHVVPWHFHQLPTKKLERPDGRPTGKGGKGGEEKGQQADIQVCGGSDVSRYGHRRGEGEKGEKKKGEGKKSGVPGVFLWLALFKSKHRGKDPGPAAGVAAREERGGVKKKKKKKRWALLQIFHVPPPPQKGGGGGGEKRRGEVGLEPPPFPFFSSPLSHPSPTPHVIRGKRKKKGKRRGPAAQCGRLFLSLGGRFPPSPPRASKGKGGEKEEGERKKDRYPPFLSVGRKKKEVPVSTPVCWSWFG